MPRANSRPSLDVLIQCPGSHGVIPDHVHEQATAMHDLGLNVLVLCCPAYTRSRASAYATIPCMIEGATTTVTSALTRKFSKATQTVRNQLRFAWEVYKHKPTLVLSASHVDSQSPLWVWPHLLMILFRKTIYAMNLHFAHRDHHLGPKWWQKLGANLAFKPFKIAIAHKRLPSPNPLPKFIRCVEVPIGPEKTVQIRENPKKIRQKWNVPRGKKVFLSFGHVRNHKNLDLVIRALLENPQAFLVILGRVSNHRDRPLKYYQMLADDLGLSKRVLISDEFVPDEKRQSYFEAADFIVSTYSSGFHSQTATLPTAAKARRYVLSSSGNSPMRDLVEHFGLGVFVEPDSSEAVADGMATLLNSELPPANWEGFEAHATWETNVMRFLEAASDVVNGRPTPVRQFEGLEDEAVPLPKILSARSLLPAKPVKAPKIEKAPAPKPLPVSRKNTFKPEPVVAPKPQKVASPKTRPVARKKTIKPKPAEISPATAATVAVEENPETAISSDAQSIFPGFEASPTKVNGVNGHSQVPEKPEPVAAPKPRRTRKPRSRIPALEGTAQLEPVEVATV